MKDRYNLTSYLRFEYRTSSMIFIKIQDEKYISFFGIKRIKGWVHLLRFRMEIKWYWTSVNLLKREALSKILRVARDSFFPMKTKKNGSLMPYTSMAILGNTNTPQYTACPECNAIYIAQTGILIDRVRIHKQQIRDRRQELWEYIHVYIVQNQSLFTLLCYSTFQIKVKNTQRYKGRDLT